MESGRYEEDSEFIFFKLRLQNFQRIAFNGQEPHQEKQMQLKFSWEKVRFALFTILSLTGINLETPAMAANWKQIDKLIDEQKLKEAEKAVIKIYEQSKGKKIDDWSRSLIKLTKIRIGLNSYESAINELKKAEWPTAGVDRTLIELYYAQALFTYLEEYSWEIRQREKTMASVEVNLKAWTFEQIYEETLLTYGKIWAERSKIETLKIDAYKDFIISNNYPKEIRSTLRDLITYKSVESLQNTSYWRNEDSEKIYRLNLEQLLNGNSGLEQNEPFKNLKAHPAQIITHILNDLRNWHQKNNAEAALEAGLSLHITLHRVFSETADRKKIRESLRAFIDNSKKTPWTARALAELAELKQEQNELVEAHKIAKKCIKDFSSDQAKKCKYIAKVIEQPHLHLTSMRTDGLNKRSILVSHKNISNVFFRAYKINLNDFLKASTEQIVPAYNQHQALLKQKADFTWKQSVQETPDFLQHNTYVVPPFKEKGFYVIMASVDANFKKENNVISSTMLNISNLVTTTSSFSQTHTITVVDGNNGALIKDAEVTFYKFEYGKKHRILETKKTDSNGEVSKESDPSSSFFIVARKDNDLTIDENTIYSYERGAKEKNSQTLIYTDRQVYRPKQKVKWKLIAYTHTDGLGDYKIVKNKTIEVYLRDTNRKELAKIKVQTNEFGTAFGEFDIPEGSLLGNWHIGTNHGYNNKWIQVEEYKRPTFEITFQDISTNIELNKKATISANAKYFFGSPVSEGKVAYRISRSTIYPKWWGYFYTRPQYSAPIIVNSGEVTLKNDGSFDISFVPEAKKAETDIEKAKKYAYEVTVEITDNGGETRTESKKIVAGYALMEVEFVEKLICYSGSDCNVQAVLKNLNGVPQEGKGEIKVINLVSPKETIPLADMPGNEAEWIEDSTNFTTTDDKIRPRWDNSYSIPTYIQNWKEGSTYSTKTVQHDKNGKASLALANLAAGAYKIVYRAKDSNGTSFSTWSYVVVAAPKSDLKIPLVLEFDKAEQRSGNKAQIIAHSGFDVKGATVNLFHSGKVIKKFSLNRGVNFFEVPITPEMRGGLTATLEFINDFQYYKAKAVLFVPWDNKELDVSFSTLREQMTPGMEETLTIKVKGSNAKDRAAEILTFMYDKSLDLFGQNVPVAPISLFPNTFEVPDTRTNLMARAGSQIASAGFSIDSDFPFYSSDKLTDIDGDGTGGSRLRRKSKSYSLEGGVRPMPLAAPSAMAEDTEGAPQMDNEAKTEAPSQESPQLSSPKLRENFNETAFFAPDLVTDATGNATLTFKLPDSLTTWHVWAVAMMKDFSSGIAHKEVQTTKDLMVRLYTPRLFREGDKISVQVVVNNTSKKSLSGLVSLRLNDEEDKDVAKAFNMKVNNAAFSIEPDATSATTIDLIIPPGVGSVKLSAIATSGNISDGEIRTLPILPGRMHLAQSRFVALNDNKAKKLQFSDLKSGNDASLINEKLVVTVDGQLFFSTLKSLPYLVEYPYECTEQTLNKFLSAGIMASLFKNNPNLVKAAKEMSKRITKYEPWSKDDPNSRMLLEETPWLNESMGGQKNENEVLINLLKKETAESIRSVTIAKLKKYQTASGGFPWFPGGEPSAYMTLYLLNGFAKAEEFDIPLPQDVISKAWSFVGANRENLGIKPEKTNLEYLTFFLFTASSFKDQKIVSKAFSDKDRTTLLNYSFKHWKSQSPYSKLMLSLTLHRANKLQEAKLVLDSILDSAITDEATGTHWAPEDRSWLWYNDTIETHAFALRAMTEMRPKDPITSGLVHWLFLNKKLNQWKSTKATSEVIYSLASWMRATGSNLEQEEVVVQVGPTKQNLTYPADKYEGRKYVEIEPSKILPAMADITIQKQKGALMFASAAWHYSTEKLPATSSGDFFKIERSYFKRQASANEMTLKPIKQGQAIQVGDEIEVQISIISKHESEYIHLRDPRPAGFEPITITSGHKWDLGLNWYEEVRDNGTNFFFENIPSGEYTFRYRMRAANAGVFRSLPAEIQSMYAPEFNGFSSGMVIEVKR
jgi:uncharacterized protein YfaS (alpha-2-macroglobulin family)